MSVDLLRNGRHAIVTDDVVQGVALDRFASGSADQALDLARRHRLGRARASHVVDLLLLDGPVEEEKIYHMAGSRTPEAMTPREIERLIRAAGREPVERDTLYNVVRHDRVTSVS